MNTCLLLSTMLAVAAPPDAWRPTRALVIETESERRRVPVTPDAVLRAWAQMELDPVDATPSAGGTLVDGSGSERTWRVVDADEQGAIPAPRSGWALVSFNAEEAYDAILVPGPSSLLFVNGMPRGGEAYNLGFLEHPMRVREGRNTLLYALGRGPVSPVIRPAEAPAQISTRDRTLPHVRLGEPVDAWAGLVVLNTSGTRLAGAMAEADMPDGSTTRVPMPPIEAHSAMQTAFRIAGSPPLPGEPYPVTVRVVRGNGAVLAEERLELAVRAPGDWFTSTYRSDVDGSVQYYSMREAIGASDGEPRGLIVSLHGAGVEASGQITHYRDQDWAHTVAVTNRRRFGFDHEDWGRADMMEVIADVERHYAIDQDRVHVTGHSMGGHGTWINGLMDAQRFGAIGPSSGWASFWTYQRGERIEDDGGTGSILRRAANVSDTLLLLDNALRLGIYILHAQDDRNVPVREARAMRERLGRFHTDWAYYERPGAGHWWGSDCLRWTPMIDFLRDRTRKDARTMDFTVVDPHLPGLMMRGVTVLGQAEIRSPSRLDARWTEADGVMALACTTENVTRLAVDARDVLGGAEPARVAVEIDGTTLEIPAGEAVQLERAEGGWRPATDDGSGHKSARLPSGFKSVFNHRPFLVYGTAGTDDENAWGRAKTRFDAETFRYRGNGRLVVISDEAYLALPAEERSDRNVVLYGNAETNRAWSEVIPEDAPFDLRRGTVRVGDEVVHGDDLALMLAHPGASGDHLVGVVGGTGPVGLRVTTPMRFFLSGAHFPDWVVCTPEVLEKGWEAVLGCGFFDSEWRHDEEQTAWRPGPRRAP